MAPELLGAARIIPFAYQALQRRGSSRCSLLSVSIESTLVVARTAGGQRVPLRFGAE
jgi:hypothetical protein